MSDYIKIQYQEGQNSWREANTIVGKTNSQKITHSMKQLQRLRPNACIRAVYQDGRLVDML